MSGSDVQDTAAQYRAELKAASKTAAQALDRAYGAVSDDLARDYKRFLRAWEAEKKQAAELGYKVDRKWLTRNREYQALIGRYEAGLRALAPLVGDTTARVSTAAATAGSTQAASLIAAAQSVEAAAVVLPVTHAVAVTQSGPVADLIAARAGAAAQNVTDILTTAVARGQNPRITATLIRRAAGGEFQNAFMVVRTEQFRAYRSAAMSQYQASPRVSQWRWDARCDSRTCVACWAMHGTVHDVSEEMNSHPACGCVPLPVVEDVTYRADGDTLFAAAPAATQKQILGPAAYLAYKDGAIKISDMVRTHKSPVWGDSPARGSLRDAVGPVKAREYTARALGRTV